ncbi:Uncharacterised protein [Escherichia coli]|nr:Uncharacterised protein [Escherichia coli]
MDKLEINDQFAVILFEDKTGGACCKKKSLVLKRA